MKHLLRVLSYIASLCVLTPQVSSSRNITFQVFDPAAGQFKLQFANQSPSRLRLDFVSWTGERISTTSMPSCSSTILTTSRDDDALLVTELTSTLISVAFEYAEYKLLCHWYGSVQLTVFNRKFSVVDYQHCELGNSNHIDLDMMNAARRFLMNV